MILNLTFDDVKKMKENFLSSPKNIVAMNAASNNAITAVSLKREYVAKYNHVFSHEIPSMKITNQEHSGRCWIFAGLNVFKYEAAKNLNLEQFEFSQSYEMFWDKLEKANYFLESIIKTSSEDLQSRLVSWLLQRLVEDGGQWGMFSNLVKKYGVVPKDVMKESYNTSNSQIMNMLLKSKLREDAMLLRKMHDEGKSLDEIMKRKKEMLSEIYNVLAVNIGIPPERFDYEYRDKEGNYHRIENITPQEFFERYVKMNLDKMVSLINCPTPDKEYMKTYTVDFLGNVVGGDEVVYLNVDLESFKNIAMKAVMDEKPTWFASDVGKMMEREKGILDTDVFDFENLYGVNFNLTKSQRLDYGDSLMTHAMVLLGVDVMDGKPTKWKVENSWGDKNGKDGYFIMGEKWFEEYAYEIVVDESYLSDEMKEAWRAKPIVLPPWDPMGSVARVK
ncbi:C1 family peptidase [Mesoaciditoga lauensis]|uniref:C1 family peptidase n=1 Tax=Mesoaciditoga lauensis TaxID=1495039 RepID=UPI0005620CAC